MTPTRHECAGCRHVAVRIRTAVWGLALSAALVSSLWLAWAAQGTSTFRLDELGGLGEYDLKTWILVAVPLAVAAAAEGTKEPAAFAAYTAYLVGTGIGHAVLGAGYRLGPGAVLALTGSIGLTLLFCYAAWRGPWGRLSGIWPRPHGE